MASASGPNSGGGGSSGKGGGGGADPNSKQGDDEEMLGPAPKCPAERWTPMNKDRPRTFPSMDEFKVGAQGQGTQGQGGGTTKAADAMDIDH